MAAATTVAPPRRLSSVEVAGRHVVVVSRRPTDGPTYENRWRSNASRFSRKRPARR